LRCWCGSRHTRHSTSFPTRRSSDLAQDLDPLDVERVEIAREDCAVRKTAARAEGRLVLVDRHRRCDAAGVDAAQHEAAEARGRLDRKSTRLNSSHVKMSYAVFCLKK